jgi:hypothetical protein
MWIRNPVAYECRYVDEYRNIQMAEPEAAASSTSNADLISLRDMKKIEADF